MVEASVKVMERLGDLGQHLAPHRGRCQASSGNRQTHSVYCCKFIDDFGLSAYGRNRNLELGQVTPEQVLHLAALAVGDRVRLESGSVEASKQELRQNQRSIDNKPTDALIQ